MNGGAGVGTFRHSVRFATRLSASRPVTGVGSKSARMREGARDRRKGTVEASIAALWSTASYDADEFRRNDLQQGQEMPIVWFPDLVVSLPISILV